MSFLIYKKMPKKALKNKRIKIDQFSSRIVVASN